MIIIIYIEINIIVMIIIVNSVHMYATSLLGRGGGCLLANVCAYIVNKEIENVMILFDITRRAKIIMVSNVVATE